MRRLSRDEPQARRAAQEAVPGRQRMSEANEVGWVLGTEFATG
jgi:hypothetical protein